MKAKLGWLCMYALRSNEIEGIVRDEARILAEVNALGTLLSSTTLGTHELLTYLNVIEPDARIRTTGDSVRVGSYEAPAGGPHMIREVAEFLTALSAKDAPRPILAYAAWEHLHPLTDGNGRTGRALYAWYALNKFDFCPRSNFLQEFHYEMLRTLDHGTSKGWRGLAFT